MAQHCFFLMFMTEHKKKTMPRSHPVSSFSPPPLPYKTIWFVYNARNVSPLDKEMM